MDPWLRKAMERATGRRPGHAGARRRARPKPDPGPRPEPPPREAVAPIVRAAARLDVILKDWYRRMTMKHHPDRGGSNHAQMIINDCYKTLAAATAEIGGGR
jgi:hypothetical protein